MDVANSTTCDENICNKISHLYTMYFRHGVNPNITKGFHCAGDLEDAIKVAQEHCWKMGYRYIFVRPVVSNLKADEYYKLHGHAEGDGAITP